MIKSFAHKGLELFYRKGSKAGIRPDHAAKLRRQLTALDGASDIAVLDVPGWHLHRLIGSKGGYWSLRVSANWRLIFVFDGRDANLVDYIDYH
ncbi:type II toxin-antitoxin system RelE/ParE family toxin [Massilia terrae]|uniref:Type II toxin-antitoxin system RelE/ParE family toxin n=1 Tax=Massilia terrae TaxID=1811224 RepID=A0ABT2CUN0_9BURK|nr:type II toxin-antitoxin system RelE/ParE family toxin [Massilia terrae]MCS0657689.1 type II toxin-antitoxin system RelE/ParE family toxin [Massilia terrae]